MLFNFVLYEAALRSQLGGPEVMGGQLQQLLKWGELRNVPIQVLPVGRECGVVLGGPIVLLETPEHEHYAYVEAPQTGVLYADPARVSALTQRHGMTRMYALSVVESAEFIREVAEAPCPRP
ncbi:Scr1 family TA system antitoxin-like transcriptional regulator [Streptomyces sp. NPDC051684]|uniref:Scr1 family TA system antitoxin-like transcriptional regulator n=1 Tax=Streptomyces sp. NPDC051684 TaxID=3365670 RepID=UPI003789EB5E